MKDVNRSWVRRDGKVSYRCAAVDLVTSSYLRLDGLGSASFRELGLRIDHPNHAEDRPPQVFILLLHALLTPLLSESKSSIEFVEVWQHEPPLSKCEPPSRSLNLVQLFQLLVHHLIYTARASKAYCLSHPRLSQQDVVQPCLVG